MTITADPPAAAGDWSWIEMVRHGLTPDEVAQQYATPGELAKALDEGTVQTPALDAIDRVLVEVAEGKRERQIFSMPPQEGKSDRISRRFVVYMLKRNPNLRIAIVSATLGISRRFGGQIRDDLRTHPELGLTLSESTKAKHEFELLGYRGGVVCVGIEGSLTSRPVDLLIIDDPYKDAGDADSDAWRETVRNFWTEVALARLSKKAPVVLVQTRWREDDLAGWLLSEGDDWQVLNIPAQADHDPDKGETDVLDREPGEFMVSARRRDQGDWLKRRREVGSRAWNAQYQGRPSPAEGTILKREWWQTYEQPQWLLREDGAHLAYGFDEVLISWDMAFKDTKSSDYVAGQVWGRRGANAYLLDQSYGRRDFVDTLKAFRKLAAKWPQATYKIVEDKANGPAVIAMLHQKVIGIVPEEPQGSKVARASAIAPLVEAKNVWLPAPEIAPWIDAFIEECAGFPTAKHDDRVDAMTQALNRLILQPFLAGETHTVDELDEELAGYGSYVPG